MPRVSDPKKENKTERIWQRVDKVILLMCDNDLYLQKKRNKELTDIVMEKFNVSRRTAYRYIDEAHKEVSKIGQKNNKKAFKHAMRDRMFLFLNAKNGIKDKGGKYVIKPNHKLALEIIKDREELYGLYIQKVEHSGKISFENIDYKKYSKEQLKRLSEAKSEEEVLRLINEFNAHKN